MPKKLNIALKAIKWEILSKSTEMDIIDFVIKVALVHNEIIDTKRLKISPKISLTCSENKQLSLEDINIRIKFKNYF